MQILSNFLTIILVFILSKVNSHGFISQPPPRPITPLFRSKIPSVMNTLSDHELQRYPLNYIERVAGSNAQMFYDQGVYTLPCRGIDFSGQVTDVQAGQSLNVMWQIDARHPGFCSLNLIKNGVNNTLAVLNPCAEREGTFSYNLQLPSDLSGCNGGGECYIQWVWEGLSNMEEYVNCIDIRAVGNSVPTSTSSQTTETSSIIDNSTTSTETTSSTASPTTDFWDEDEPEDEPSVSVEGEETTEPTLSRTSSSTFVSTSSPTTSTASVSLTKTTSSSSWIPPSSTPSKPYTPKPTNNPERCNHGDMQCFGPTPQHYRVCNAGTWTDPMLVVWDPQLRFKCKQIGNKVTVVRI